MESHIRELYETVRSSSSIDRQSEWHDVEQRLKEQMPLRAVSCIQVSSKLATHYKVELNILSMLSPPRNKAVLSHALRVS